MMNGLKRLVLNHTGYSLTAATLLSVGGWRLAVMSKPDRIQAVATELGSIGQYKDDLYPNKGGTGIVYTEDVETGEGLFFSPMPGGKNQQLCVLNESEFAGQRFGMLGWSTDDSLFVYAMAPDKKSRTDILYVCDGKTGQVISKVQAPANVAGLVWLTPDSFAYLAPNNHIIKVVVHEQTATGRWMETRDFGQVYRGRGSPQNLVATSTNSVAWHNGSDIWEFDFHASAPTVIWRGGSSEFSADEIKDLRKLVNRLPVKTDPVSAFLWQRFSRQDQALLTNYVVSAANAAQVPGVVVQALNKAIAEPSIYESNRFQGVSLRPETASLIQQNPKGPVLARLNRLLLEDAYPVELARRLRGVADRIVGLAYAAERGEFLLNCADNKGRYLVRFSPSRQWTEEGGRMDDLLHPVRNLSWGNGPSYAYLWNDQGTNTIFVRMDGQEDLTRLPWPGPIRTYTFSGDCLYVAGSVGKDPAGLYRFDIKNKALALIVSSLRQPLQYAKLVPPVDGVFTNGAGTLATYHVWRPANFSPHQKYPVILCQTPYIWTPFPQIAANAGYYYALVDRPSWSDGLTRWCDDVAGLYNVMVKDPNVDPERVFLYGASAETGYIHQFVSEKPDSCRGLIFFSAAVPPPLSGTRLSSMVLIIGQDEGPAVVQRWKKYQNDAAEQGIRVSLDFESGAQHISRSIATERDRARQLAKYLEEN